MSRRNIVILSLALLAIGLFMVYQSSLIWANYLYNDGLYYLKRQFLFAAIGIALMIFFSKINLHKLRKYSLYFLIIGLISLVLVLIIGVNINGSSSWFKIGSFLIQPSELFKIVLVFYMADRLDKYYYESNKFFKTIIILLIPTALSFGLIMLQPDLGSGIVLLGAIVVMCITTKNKFKNYMLLIVIGIIAFTVLIITSPYRKERILSYLDPYSDPLGSGFQLIQSLYAIGPGGIVGKGINNSYQKYFYLPEPQTDFIFAIIAEEYGLIGTSIILLLYALLFKNIFIEVINSKNEFKAFLKIGMANLIIIQVLINLCVVVGLIPVTGITLPFLSYGGSSLIVMLSSIGIIINTKGDNDEIINIR